jgi:Spy/CpxP family protein refolding chaperone
MNSKPLLSTTDDDLKQWRDGGRSERTLLLLLALAILALVLIGIKVASSAPLPQAGPEPSRFRAGQRQGWHRGPGPMGPEQELGWLSDRLKLTDDQKAKIKPLIEDEHKQLTALREDTSQSREEKRAKFKQIHASTYDQIRPLLTEPQQATLKQMEEQREQRMKARQGRGGQAPPPQQE